MFYTYAHTKPDGTIFYIGKGKDRRAWVAAGRNSHWRNVVAKYGYDVCILSEHETEQEAFAEEIELISHFGKFGFLVNKTYGGEGGTGHTVTEAHKKILRERFFGVPLSEEHKRKISENHPRLSGKKACTFKGSITATCVKTGNQVVLNGHAEIESAGFNNKHVYSCVNGKRKTHKGHTFKREEK